MKHQVRRLLLLCTALLLTTGATAIDEKDIRAFDESIRRQVWSMDLKEFQHPKTTDRYADHSAVILAAYEEYTVSDRDKINFFSSTGVVNELKYQKLLRQLVQINDEAALKYYSEFDYMAYVRRTSLYSGKSVTRRVLGVRVIKPDGTVSEVKTDDYVDATEGKKGKDRRKLLAVPGLQVGDIVDIFTYVVHKSPGSYTEPMVFCFLGEYPMLSYRVHCKLGWNVAAQYRTLNGAPDFKVTTDEDDNHLLDVYVENIEKTEPRLWYDVASQSPLILLTVHGLAKNKTKTNSLRRGLQANPDAKSVQADDWVAWNYPVGLAKDDKAVINEAISRFTDARQRADYIYEYSMSYHLSARLRNIMEIAYVNWLRSCFRKAGIDFQCGITTLEGHEPIDELADINNTFWFLRLPDGRCYFPPTFACRPGEVPSQLQGRKAVVCNDAKKLTKGPYEQIVLPQSQASDNVYATSVRATIDGLQLHIGRTSTLTGAVRQNLSMILPTRQELVNSVMEGHPSFHSRSDLFGAKEKSSIDEQDVKDKELQKETMADEVEAYHNEKPAQMGEGHLISVGNSYRQQGLSWEVNYTMDGFVKRAGQNLVVAIGKLMGDQLKLQGISRQRTADVVRDAPATFSWDITLSLSQGYTVAPEALEYLRADISNTVGSFSAEPTIGDNGTLQLKVSKTISHKREPLANWQQVVELYDYISDYTSRQVVLNR